MVAMLKARPHFSFDTPNRAFAMPTIQLPPNATSSSTGRQWIIYLMGCAAMAGTIIGVLTPGENLEVVFVPTGVFFLAHDRTEPRRTRALPDGIRPREEANLE